MDLPHGKRGELRMGFELDGNGRSILRDLYRKAPLIVQQALYFDEQMPNLPCVYILSSGGPVVEGDSFEQHITLRRNSSAHISTGAATKVAQMRGGEARLRQRIELHEGAYLEYLPEAVIPCRRACYEVDTEIVAHHSAVLFYSEIYMSGRRYSGERFCYWRLALHTRVERADGEVVYVDNMQIEPQSEELNLKGVMHDYEVFASVLILAPRNVVLALREQLQPFMRKDMALGVNLLPFDAGLGCRILAMERASAKSEIRRICSLLRQKVKGVALPEEFPWR
ncbi:MAG: urease accessory protein UreD [Alistipes sp.]|nr:urease accessory protein UreD [Alistipes sp.]